MKQDNQTLKGAPSFTPTQQQIEAAEHLTACMAYEQGIAQRVTALQRLILDAGQWRADPKFASPGQEAPMVTDPASAWTLAESDFAIYDGHCQKAYAAANLKARVAGNCPKLEAEECTRQAKRALIQAMRGVGGFDLTGLIGLPQQEEAIDLMMRLLGNHLNTDRAMKAFVAQGGAVAHNLQFA